MNDDIYDKFFTENFAENLLEMSKERWATMGQKMICPTAPKLQMPESSNFSFKSFEYNKHLIRWMEDGLSLQNIFEYFLIQYE